MCLNGILVFIGVDNTYWYGLSFSFFFVGLCLLKIDLFAWSSFLVFLVVFN